MGMEEPEFTLGARVRMWSQREGGWKIGTVRGLNWVPRLRGRPDSGPDPEYRQMIFDGTTTIIECRASDLRPLDEAAAASNASRGPAAASASERALPANERIGVYPGTMGWPVFCGSRIPVALVLRKLGEGATEAELVDAYPGLTSEVIRVALLFAPDAIANLGAAEDE